MPSTSARSDAMADDGTIRVEHYDGVSAMRREPVLVPASDNFTLVEDDRTTGPFAFADLVPRDSPGMPSFGLKDSPGWWIAFPHRPPAALATKLPRHGRYGGVIDRFGLWPATAVFAALAMVAVVLVLRTPALVARLVPVSVERRLGDVMIGDFGRNGCAAPAGVAALDTLARRIDPYDPTLEVHVVKLPMINAVTLPGGRIVIFDGLLQSATSPDEIAGVVGHEIGHVRHHDVMESLLRQIGLSVLLGGMEGHVGGYTNALLATSYSRSAEAKADGFAIQLLRTAKVSPLPTAAFFDRLGSKSANMERMTSYLASHPVSVDRARRFRASAAVGRGYTPTLDAATWQALKHICKGAPDQLRWRF